MDNKKCLLVFLWCLFYVAWQLQRFAIIAIVVATQWRGNFVILQFVVKTICCPSRYIMGKSWFFFVNFYHAMHTRSALYTVAQYPSVCHKPVVYQNGIMDWAGFRHIGYLQIILHCVVNEFGFLQKMRVLVLVLHSELMWFFFFLPRHVDLRMCCHRSLIVAYLLLWVASFVYKTWPWCRALYSLSTSVETCSAFVPYGRLNWLALCFLSCTCYIFQ